MPILEGLIETNQHKRQLRVMSTFSIFGPFISATVMRSLS